MDDRHMCHVRLRSDLRREINQVRRQRGQTFQTFAQLALRREVNAARELAAEAERQRASKRNGRERVQGLGIRARLAAEAEDSAIQAGEPLPPVPAAPPPQPVVVDVHAPAAGGVAVLARMVAAAPGHERKAVLRAAVTTLRDSTHDGAEQLRLAEELDAAIARLGAAPATALERVRARRGG